MYTVQIEHAIRDFDGWKVAFETQQAAESFVTAMQAIWPRVEGTVIIGPSVRIVDLVEHHDY